ncbi:MAG: iron transporter [Clostridiales bacterium]|nr:iron transporter [Clostridiales bacterium]
MKKLTVLVLTALLVLSMGACGQSTAAPEATVKTGAETTAAAETTEGTAAPETVEATAPALADGVYLADFNTDSTMFHTNEVCEGKGTLTVQDGKMTIHVSLASTSILNLYPGLAEDAQKDGAELLQPSKDELTYPDGLKETVNGFDIPVPALDQEFDVALIGKKGKWYDHKVSVSNPVPQGQETLADGEYTVEAVLFGGTGKAKLLNPTALTVSEGKITATIVWSSSNYDYMIVNGDQYLPITTEGGSTFQIPVESLGVEIPVTADTVAMGTPHEIAYTILLQADTVSPKA